MLSFRKIFLLILLVGSIVCFQPAVGSENDEHDDTSVSVSVDDEHERDDDDNHLIAENPDYVESPAVHASVEEQTEITPSGTTKPKSNATSTTDKDVKGMLGKALAKSKAHVFVVTPSNKAFQFISRHRNAIFLTLAITAFHREITQLLGKVMFQSVKDPKTGQIIVRRRLHFPIRPTTILKFIVLVEVIRRVQQRSKASSTTSISSSSSSDIHEGSSDSDSASLTNLPASMIAALLLLLGISSGNPAMMMFLLRLLLLMWPLQQNKNTAYVPPIRQHYTFERFNERYQKDKMAFQKAAAVDHDDSNKRQPISLFFMPARPRKGRMHNVTSLSEYIRMNALLRKQAANTTKQPEPTSTSRKNNNNNETIVVMDWTDLDSSISQMEVLRDEVSFLLDTHKMTVQHDTNNDTDDSSSSNSSPKLDEVVVLLESPGGSAADYSLASQQILRLRNRGIKVTVCVDKVAASGGYMIACTSSPGHLYASSMAVLGSIGVLGQTFNIHKVLEGWGVRPLVFRGGKDKAPVGLIGEVTEEGIAKVQDMIDKTHRAFKRHVTECRPVLASDIEELASGDVWLGYDALELGLVDRIVTSDEYLAERTANGARVLKLVQVIKPRYPFQRPTTTSLLSKNTGGGNRSWISLLASDFGGSLKKLLDIFGAYLSEMNADPMPITRSAGGSDIRLGGSNENAR